MRHRPRWLTSVVVIVVGVTMSTLPAQTAMAEAPQPAGLRPSSIAKEVCQQKARNLISDVLGERATVSSPSWRGHLYSCAYQYAEGDMVLSVKELSNWRQTYSYFDGLGKTLHKTMPIFQLGQGAFRVGNGSVVVRKDWKVLLVDVGGLPPQFGNPPSDPAGVALSVAAVILGCWHGD